MTSSRFAEDRSQIGLGAAAGQEAEQDQPAARGEHRQVVG